VLIEANKDNNKKFTTKFITNCSSAI